MTIQKHCKKEDKSRQNICIATVVEISISILVVHSFSSNNAKHNNVRYDLLKERERKKCMIFLFVCYPWMTFFPLQQQWCIPWMHCSTENNVHSNSIIIHLTIEELHRFSRQDYHSYIITKVLVMFLYCTTRAY